MTSLNPIILPESDLELVSNPSTNGDSQKKSSRNYNCIGCNKRKRRNEDPFRNLVPLHGDTSEQNQIDVANYIRTRNKRRKLPLVTSIEELGHQRQICSSCHYHARKFNNSRQNGSTFSLRQNDSNQVYSALIPQQPDETPDLSFYRQGVHSHQTCVFKCHKYCKDPRLLINVSKQYRHILLMQYKFFVENGARMCTSHLNTQNWWPLVKQVDRQLPPERYFEMMELMHYYYNEKFSDSGNTKKRKRAENQAKPLVNNLQMSPTNNTSAEQPQPNLTPQTINSDTPSTDNIVNIDSNLFLRQSNSSYYNLM